MVQLMGHAIVHLLRAKVISIPIITKRAPMRIINMDKK
jgi:hypothetical protein